MTINLNRRGLLAAMGATGLAAAVPAFGAPRTPLFKRINKPLGVQLYALGEAAQKDLGGTLKRLAAMGYTDFELPGLYGRSPKDLRADADAAGVRFGSIHMGMPQRLPAGSLTLMSSPQEIADALGTMGIRKAVLPMPLLPDDFKMPAAGGDMRAALVAAVDAGGLDMWKRLGGLLNERAHALKPYGIDLGYHNHNMEFRPQGGTTGWNVLLGELDPKLVFLELDLGWAAAGGLDPAAEIRRLKGRIKMVHLKDIKASTKTNYALSQDPAEVGLGMLNWHKILPACAESGVENFYVEQEAPFTRDRFDSMKISHDYLAKFVA
ncbi:sugar phosphate isomerase/epimerase family protein [Novosphingobium sediminicola]|uniref:Sugar phosphate isomerase/epimerase n=1 Tax=Novosphingobium sediminicola TaxID=563162 RepID=A0A7W6CSJ4_9SPHN|nr:sugar phosphate isomerase/epimerase [Novosphingobium sediminicola]MBB3957022.1 sugar phosphate isomerase/epimerase [Novosphingobium sediminicola]